MARNRQRAKQRQAERRARQTRSPERGQARRPEPLIEDPTAVEPSPAVDPELAVGAPPQDEGRSDTVIAAEQAEEQIFEEDEAFAELEDRELRPEEADGAEPAYAPRGRRGREEARGKDRPRVIQFLIAVWAELQRVQWPNRQALTALTGVTLVFVLIVGSYLGLLDTIFNRIVQAIL
jgi:preprotein translocase SecE subunit